MQICIACLAKYFGFIINTTAFCLGRYSLHILLLKSSMVIHINDSFVNYYPLPTDALPEKVEIIFTRQLTLGPVHFYIRWQGCTRSSRGPVLGRCDLPSFEALSNSKRPKLRWSLCCHPPPNGCLREPCSLYSTLPKIYNNNYKFESVM